MIKIEYEGEMLEVTNMFDVDGEDTEVLADVRSLVAKRSETEWLAFEFPQGLQKRRLS